MRVFPFSIFACITMLVSCARQKQAASLPGVFVESLIQQNFDLLEPYFPTIEFHKSLERNATDQPDSVALKFVEENNIKLKGNWTNISERIKAGNIDLSKVKIIETISAQPFWTKNISRMVIVYSYENKNWDDLELIVGELNGKKLLLEIPDPERVFSMKDSTLKASKDARFEIEIKTPEFKKTLQDKVDKIISHAKENKIKEFREFIYYPGGETTGAEPDSVSTDESRAQITGFMEKINNIMTGCDNPVYGDVNTLDLPEGKWIVIQLKCSNKFVHFAFTRTGDKILLNDVDEAGIK